MKNSKFSITFSLGIVLFLALSAFAQGDSFSDTRVDYSFDLPDAKWKLTVKPTDTSPNVEYVYGDRTNGHLDVRKLRVSKDEMMSEIIKDEEQKLQFKRGYMAGKEDNFLGRLRGVVFSFEYVDSGKIMGGRFYFLRANDTTVYMLRFTGLKDSLRSIHNQTDSIARTFAVKAAA